MTTVEHPRTHIQGLVDAMTLVDLAANDPAVEALVANYRRQFALGPRDRATERAKKWRGARYQNRIVAVFGESLVGRTLEVTDAYHDESAAGLAGFMSLAHGYLALLNSGEIDQLAHVVLFTNEAHWRAVIKATGDMPKALVFVHQRKGD